MAIAASTVSARSLASTVVVETPLVVVADAVANAEGSSLVLGVEVVDIVTSTGESGTKTRGVDRNVANVASNNVVSQLTDVGEDHENDRGKSQELACVELQ